MTITIKQLTDYLNLFLKPEQWKDYCPNGLQVNAQRPISNIVSGVSVCQDLLDQAIVAGADVVLVHHGFFWRGEDPCLLGIKYRRISTLIKNDLYLLAYHLPLDGNPIVGNNVQLAKKLNITITGEFFCPQGPGLGLMGEFPQAVSGDQLQEHILNCLNRQPLYVRGKSQQIKRIAWCTGAAQDFIDQAIAHEVDAYLTGEVSERTVHISRESGIHFFAAGHHATERYGVKALGEHLSEYFNIEHQFIDIDNPV